ncbi:MAG: protease inhibitor I9 family protein [Deltaproteobacteria bacterium]|nr:protease inhibitor I9 family protein [Deltaproteobacteria bacterium]
MTRQYLLTRLLFLSFLLTAPAFFLPLPASGENRHIIPGQYIIVLKDDAEDPSEAVRNTAHRHGLTPGHVYSKSIRGFSARLSADRLDALKKDPSVRFVEPDLVVAAVTWPSRPPVPMRSLAPTPSPQPPQVIPTGINRIDAELNVLARINGVDERVKSDSSSQQDV